METPWSKAHSGSRVTEEATVIIFDRDQARRAKISRMLGDSNMHAEPCQDLSDLGLYLPDAGVILVHDEADNIRKLDSFLTSHPVWLPFIAYQSEPVLTKIVSAMKVGAIEYLEWPFDNERMIVAIREALETSAFEGELKRQEQRAKVKLDSLTLRERQIIFGISRGLTTAQVGKLLSISPKTVDIHRLNAIKKLGARRTADAIRVLVEARCTETPDLIGIELDSN